MNTQKILITTSSFCKENNAPLRLLKKHGLDPILNPCGRKLTGEEVKSLLKEHQPIGMIAGIEPLTKDVLEGAKGLRVISRCGIGLDSIDLPAAERSGIIVLNTPDAPSLAVAELTVGLILAVLRNISFIDRSIRKGEWQKPMGQLLSGKTVGIIGAGRIGTTIAHLLCGFHCVLLGYDPKLKEHPLITLVDMNTLLKESDIITIHVPYSKDTHHLIHSGNIPNLKKGSIVINTSRGGIIDEEAVCKAINDGHIAGAGIDCFEREPYCGTLSKCDHVILTSHIGSYAKESRNQMEMEAAENLLKALKNSGALK